MRSLLAVAAYNWITTRAAREYKLQALVAGWRLRAARVAKVPRTMEGGQRDGAVSAGYERWECEGCRDELLTRGWKWRWCATCVEEGIAAKKKRRRLKRQVQELEDTAHEAQRRLAMIEDAQEQASRLRDEHVRSAVVQDHREILAEMEEAGVRARTTVHELWEEKHRLQAEVKKAGQEWERLQASAVGAAVTVSIVQTSGQVVLQRAGEVMHDAVAGNAGFYSTEMGQGLTLWNYKKVDDASFEASEVTVSAARAAVVRRECRGLVVNEEGSVVARPLHRFFSAAQVLDARMIQTGKWRVIEATEKLDGIMVYGVGVGGAFELWTRSGRTKESRAATRWAIECGSRGADYDGLMQEVEARGCTAVFEWVGRQARIKVKEADTRLVLLQVRDKAIGTYMGYEQRAELAAQFRVQCVRRVPQLEGKSVWEAHKEVKKWESGEGVVIRMAGDAGGYMMKVKTNWWHEQQQHRYQRWHSVDQRESEARRTKRKWEVYNVKELRAK